MPLVDYNLQSTWDSLYSIRIRDPQAPDFQQRVGYGRRFAQRVQGPYSDTLDYYKQRKDWAALGFQITPASQVLVVGCGYGYLIEELKAAGLNKVYGLDYSTYLQANWAANASPQTQIVWADALALDSSQVKNAMRSTFGTNTFDYIITDSMLESFTDQELAALWPALESRLARNTPINHIIHIVDDLKPGDNPTVNLRWLTLQEWAALRPTHSWLSANGGQYIIGSGT